MSLHTCNRSLWMMINYYQLSFPVPKRCALWRHQECREDFGNDSSGGGFDSPYLGGITTSSQAGCGTRSHAAARAGAPGNCWFGRKKTPTNVLIGKGCFSRERREKNQAQQKAWQLAGVESDSSHRAVQMSEEISGCIQTLLAPEWLFRSVQNLIAPAIGVIIAAKGARGAAGVGRIRLL